jgi:tetratricopeptide (TPR) repeat protein
MANLAHFTDRKSQIAAFEALWKMPMPWIVVFSGVSGNGKSTLIDWLIEKKCRPQGIESVKIDMHLSGGLNLPVILTRLADLLSPNAAQRFRAEYTAATQTFNRNLADLIKAKAAQPIDIDMTATAGSQISGSSIRVQADNAGEDALRKNYHAWLTATLCAERANLRQQPTALFLDTFERAQDNIPGPEMEAFWALLEELHYAAPQLRVVVGGREDLAHQSARSWRHQVPLEAFSRSDSAAFLTHWSNGQIPTELCEAIFKLAQGHPLLTEMAAEVWRDGQATGHPLTLAELKEGLTHRSGNEWLYGRIINRLEALGNLSLAAAARYGPLLRTFTMRSLNAILPADLHRLGAATFEQFIGYAFIKRAGAGWAFHELMRDTQRAYLIQKDDPEVDDCHRRAVEFFEERAKITREPEMARNALYHACFVNPANVFNEWQEETFRAQLAGARGWWDELLATLEAPAQNRRLSSGQKGQVFRNRGMWSVRNYHMEAALESYRQALDLFRAVGDRLGEANTLKAIGDVQRFKDENEAALESYRQALDLFRAVGSRLGEANTLQAIGDVQQFKKENEAALESYRQALDLFRAVGDRLGEANTLKAIGFMKLDTGEGEAGLNALNEALALYLQIGDRVGQANTYWGLGIRLAQNGKLQEAEPLLAQTLELVEQFIPGHPFTLQVRAVLEQIRQMLNAQQV